MKWEGGRCWSHERDKESIKHFVRKHGQKIELVRPPSRWVYNWILHRRGWTMLTVFIWLRTESRGGPRHLWQWNVFHKIWVIIAEWIWFCGVRQLQQRVGKVEDVCGILNTMYRTLLVNIRRTEIQRASLNLQPARAHTATFFAFVDVAKKIFSLIIFESQFLGYSPSEKDNSRYSLEL